MCPYCQKRFKSKATCRIHLQIHKAEWVRQFKEQLKSGTIQFEEEQPNQTNEHSVLDIMTSSANEVMLETLKDTTTDSHNETVVHDSQEIGQVLITDLVQETQADDSRNQFEYFLLLPANSDTNNIGIGDVRTETEQFMVNDDQLNFSNLQFIQLDESALYDMQNSQTVASMTNYQSMDYQYSELDQPMDSNSQSNMSNVHVLNSDETTINVASTDINQSAFTSKKLTRTRKSTKSINKCETCSKIFQKPIDLRRHIRTHTLEKVI